MAKSFNNALVNLNSSLATGASLTSSAINISAVGASGDITAQVTFTTAGASPGVSVALLISGDGTNYYDSAFSQTTGFAASTTYNLFFAVPVEASYAQIEFTNNSGQTVTCNAQGFIAA